MAGGVTKNRQHIPNIQRKTNMWISGDPERLIAASREDLVQGHELGEHMSCVWI